jgi:hypothetical protein
MSRFAYVMDWWVIPAVRLACPFILVLGMKGYL